MDIRTISEEEKKVYIDKVNSQFDYIRETLTTLSTDMESSELMIQASAVWVGGNLCNWFSDFMEEIKKIDQKQKTLNDLKTEIKETIDVNPITNSIN